MQSSKHLQVRPNCEFRGFIWWTELNMTILESHVNNEKEEDGFGTNKEPGEIESDLSTRVDQDLV